MLGGYAGYVAYKYTGSFVAAVGSLFVAIVGICDGTHHHTAFLQSPARGSAGHVRPRHRFRQSSVRLIFRQPVNGKNRHPWFAWHHLARFHVLSDVSAGGGRDHRRGAPARCFFLYRTRDRARRHRENSVMVDDALGIDVYGVFMIVFGIGAMAAGFPGIGNSSGGSLDTRHQRRHPGPDLRRGGDRRRGLVSGRHSRRPDCGRDRRRSLPWLTPATLTVSAAMMVVRPYGLFGIRGRE